MVTKQRTKFSTVDEYIEALPPLTKGTLEQLRRTIKKAAPQAEEVISYAIPAIRQNGIVVWYAATKNHYSLFPFAHTIDVFRDKLERYETSKGTIKFPLDKPVPVKLVTDIVKFRLKEMTKKEQLKSKKVIKTTKQKSAAKA